jgi:DMSO/TMAO reductase YedYZ molybdopterin-dependent catalytic subunit
MKKMYIAIVFALMVASAMTLGCTGQKALTFDVKGQVDKPGTFDLNSYKDKFVTVTAKLDGKVTHVPAANYTGVPMRVILSDAGLKAGASQILVTASDGYSQVFDISNVTASDNVILIDDNDTVRIIANGYAGGMWVQKVTTLEIT